MSRATALKLAREMAKECRIAKFERTILQIMRHPDATANQIMEAHRMYKQLWKDTLYIQRVIDKEFNDKNGWISMRIDLFRGCNK